MFWLKVYVFGWKTIMDVLLFEVGLHYKMTKNSEKGKQCRRGKKRQRKK